MLHTAVQPRG